jgi:hypothetical protein
MFRVLGRSHQLLAEGWSPLEYLSLSPFWKFQKMGERRHCSKRMRSGICRGYLFCLCASGGELQLPIGGMIVMRQEIE